jgi:hypothetical protein
MIASVLGRIAHGCSATKRITRSYVRVVGSIMLLPARAPRAAARRAIPSPWYAGMPCVASAWRCCFGVRLRVFDGNFRTWHDESGVILVELAAPGLPAVRIARELRRRLCRRGELLLHDARGRFRVISRARDSDSPRGRPFGSRGEFDGGGGADFGTFLTTSSPPGSGFMFSRSRISFGVIASTSASAL